MANAVIVAEPEPATRGFLERHLADDGFDVLGAAECGEALELAERARPDLVLLGDTAALDECRSWSSEVPLIVIGAPEADAVDRARALERGAEDVEAVVGEVTLEEAPRRGLGLGDEDGLRHRPPTLPSGRPPG